MLTESIVEIGRPIVSGDMPNEQRIELLTDVNEENCKNFFLNIFVIELKGDQTAFHLIRTDNSGEQGIRRNSAFPIFYPNGGNPIRAQGIYPLPCYLTYDQHIKAMKDPEQFAEKMILPRLKNTIPYKGKSDQELEKIAAQAAHELSGHFDDFITNDKQLGILYLVDHQLPLFHLLYHKEKSIRFLWICESTLLPGRHLSLDADAALELIVESRYTEAKSLGYEKNAVSTFSNKKESEVVSVYNKSWLWLSPTWDLPQSIYWGNKEWTKGIRIDRKNYEAFLYGAQFLKRITVPIRSGLLKEMFAPVTSVEAKRNMNATSFEKVFGVPLVLPLLKGDSQQLYEKYRRILRKDQRDDDLQLKIIAGIDKMVPKMDNAHRLALLYYSGDLSRGNMHIRMMINDIIPSVASQVQKIIQSINKKDRTDIHLFLGISDTSNYHDYRAETLPSLLANAYGPGYLWQTFQSVLHREDIRADRLYRTTVEKLEELANEEEYWGMIRELAFHLMFLAFKRDYDENLLNKKGVDQLKQWEKLQENYHHGTISPDALDQPDALGYVTGLLLKQFSNSYQRKTGRDFVKHKVMKFGSKLTPHHVWKNGVLRCEELREQWDMGLAGNFYPVLGAVLAALIDADHEGLLNKDKDIFMTAFWSGYLTYRKPVEPDHANQDTNSSEEEEKVNGQQR